MDVLVCWNFFQYLLFFVKIFYTQFYQWIRNPNTLEFDESHPNVVQLRFFFFLGFFLINIPLFSRSRLFFFKYINLGFLLSFFVLIFWTMIEAPLFYSSRGADPDNTVEFFFKPFKFEWIDLIFFLSSNFTCQIYLFSFMSALNNPTVRRLKKISRISLFSVFFITCLIGGVIYGFLGDKYTPVFLSLRKPYPQEPAILQNTFILFIFIFFISLSLGIGVVMISLKDVLRKIFHLEDTKAHYLLHSTAVMGSAILIAFYFPSIVEVGKVTVVLVSAFNCYTTPILLKLSLIRTQKCWQTKTALVFLLVVINTFVLTSLGTRIYEFVQIFYDS